MIASQEAAELEAGVSRSRQTTISRSLTSIGRRSTKKKKELRCKNTSPNLRSITTPKNQKVMLRKGK